jgi:hypothetical protein
MSSDWWRGCVGSTPESYNAYVHGCANSRLYRCCLAPAAEYGAGLLIRLHSKGKVVGRRMCDTGQCDKGCRYFPIRRMALLCCRARPWTVR